MILADPFRAASLPDEWTADLGFILLNLVMVVRAIWVNRREGRHGFREFRWICNWRAGFATLYAVSYLVLLAGVVDRLQWSRIMVGVSPVVWEIVWTRPATMNGAVRRELVDSGVARIEEGQRVA